MSAGRQNFMPSGTGVAGTPDGLHNSFCQGSNMNGSTVQQLPSACEEDGVLRSSTNLTAQDQRLNGGKSGPQQQHQQQECKQQQDVDDDVFGVVGGLDLSGPAPAVTSATSSPAVGNVQQAEPGTSLQTASTVCIADQSAQPAPALRHSISGSGSSGALAAAAAAAAAQHNFAPNQAQAAQQALLMQRQGAGAQANQGPAQLATLVGDGFSAGPSIGDLPQDEVPARTLFVRNLNPATDPAELQRAFEAYGDVRTLYTACIGRGFCMISYYDLRAACLASHSLQGTLLAGSALNIHFSSPREGTPDHDEGNVTLYNLDPAVTAEKLYQSFITFGDVKDITAAPPPRATTRIIEFYDVRHAAAAYQALSQGSGSKRRTHSFDMGLLPSVPELNVQQMPTQASNESLGALTGGTESWGSGRSSHEHLNAAAVAAAANSVSPSHAAQQSRAGPLRTLSGSGSGGNLAGDFQLGAARMSLGPAGTAPTGFAAGARPSPAALKGLSLGREGSSDGLVGTPYGSAGMGVDSLRQQSVPLPPRLPLSASNSMDHLQRLSSSGLHGPPGASLLGGRARSGALPAAAASHRGGGAVGSDVFQPSSYGAASSFGGGGGGSTSFGGSSLGALQSGGSFGGGTFGNSFNGRLGDQDLAALSGLSMGSPPVAASAAAQRLQSLSSAASGQRRPSFEVGSLDGGGGVAGSHSASDLAALYEVQQAQLEAQHSQLVDQQRALQAMQSANSLRTSSQQMFMSPSAASFSPGTSPSHAGWAHLQAQQQQQQQQQQQVLDSQLRQAQVALLQAGAGNLSVGQLQALMSSQGSGDGASLHRSQSASAMMQAAGLNPLAAAHLAASLQSQASAQLGGRAGSKDMGPRRSEEGLPHSNSGSGFGGRFARRAEGGAAQERRSAQDRLYSLDLDRVLAGNDARTTLMIKNIPNKYTQKMLLATIDEHFRGTYDFFYLPIDFKNKCNVGYAFINLLQPQYVVPLVERFNNRKWDKFNSEKVCSITYARIQGKHAMVAHFQNSSLLHEDKRCRPVLFHSEGPMAGEPEPFPAGPAARLRQARTPARDTHREHKLRERDGGW